MRAVGGFDVNMDLIAGLPSDTVDSFRATLEKVLSLAPENVTVHTLSLKKGSRITLEGAALPTAAGRSARCSTTRARRSQPRATPRITSTGRSTCPAALKTSAGRGGRVNLYNICIMEELCSILAMGGGGSTKLVCPGGGRNIRLMAPKYPLEYIKISAVPAPIRTGSAGFMKKTSKATQYARRNKQWHTSLRISISAPCPTRRALSRRSDAQYQQKVEKAAALISENCAKSPIVLLSGPSGSGKTTTAMKIAGELNRRGIGTHYVSMDNYFKTIDPRHVPAHA